MFQLFKFWLKEAEISKSWDSLPATKLVASDYNTGNSCRFSFWLTSFWIVSLTPMSVTFATNLSSASIFGDQVLYEGVTLCLYLWNNMTKANDQGQRKNDNYFVSLRQLCIWQRVYEYCRHVQPLNTDRSLREMSTIWKQSKGQIHRHLGELPWMKYNDGLIAVCSLDYTTSLKEE